MRLHSDSDLGNGLAALIERDARLAAVLQAAGMPSLRRRPAGFAGLSAIICAQQLSTASASAIWNRLAAAFDPLHHDSVRRAHPRKLAAIGLSKPKIRTLKAIGTAIARGDIDLDALADMDADAAHAALIRLHGVGPWTADIYLLFCLGHADAWPAGDLALQEAARVAFGLRRRPDARAMVKLAEPWRPWRGVAAHLLWAYYRKMKQRDGTPAAVQPATGTTRSAKQKDQGNMRKKQQAAHGR